ncbi:protein YhfH [Peribacillus frigoritolerans]|nr:protein YhfH [Peribacillus frigoritolerans]WJE47909.1 protein YhfH [Peribacillus frigoritolerans]
MQANQSDLLIIDSFKHCPECGETYVDHSNSYLMECDRCLSKREE